MSTTTKHCQRTHAGATVGSPIRPIQVALALIAFLLGVEVRTLVPQGFGHLALVTAALSIVTVVIFEQLARSSDPARGACPAGSSCGPSYATPGQDAHHTLMPRSRILQAMAFTASSLYPAEADESRRSVNTTDGVIAFAGGEQV